MKGHLRSKEMKDFEAKEYYELKILRIVITDKDFSSTFVGNNRVYNSLRDQG